MLLSGSLSIVRDAPPPPRHGCWVGWLVELTGTTEARADTEYLPSDISRCLWRIRDLHRRREAARTELDGYLREFAHLSAARRRSAIRPAAGGQLSNGVNGLRAMESASASDKEMEIRYLITQRWNDFMRAAREATVEAQRLLEHVGGSRGHAIGLGTADGDRSNFTTRVS